MIDFHTHILPGIDDGSSSVEESIALLHMQEKQGVQYLMATPHFYAHRDDMEHFLKKREESFARLRAEIDVSPLQLPGIGLGAEVWYFPRMSESDSLQLLTLNESQFILVEMPCKKWTDIMYRELENIRLRQGLTPIIAHVERCIRPFRTRELFRSLEQLPVLIQANAEFYLDRSTSALAVRLLRQGRIHLLGSDCHNLKDRKPNLGAAEEVIRQRLGQDVLEWIHTHEQIVLRGR